MEYHESGTSTTGVPDAAVSDLRNDSPALLTDGCDPRNRNHRIVAVEYNIHDPPIASGLVEARWVSSLILICALLAAVLWNLATWYMGLPCSSSHALIGGLCGAALASAHGDWHALVWMKPPAPGQHWWSGGGQVHPPKIVQKPVPVAKVRFSNAQHTVCPLLA